eukprot:NODE_5064_length_728_cov_65.297837_g5041_i0.p1 GENE.NODE_5064_length_728_cov_65.297837_g5041_i0~~NODE_5064_length_728_cov_65.297837_g5041_i0.p1  ORF type:complete len:199 (-),score=40.70 NODE_5064_length_728_cov_65.297837_g5041_i0:29-625(-)
MDTKTMSELGVKRSFNPDNITKLIPTPNLTRCKVAVLGDQNVGKTGIVKHFCAGVKNEPTLGIEYYSRTLQIGTASGGEKEVFLTVWDMSGDPQFFDVRNEFYKDMNAALLVFDVTRRKSFEGLEAWLQEAGKFGAKELAVVVCGNKSDDLQNRQVGESEAKKWCQARKLNYFETSAVTGEGTKTALNALITKSVGKK